MDTTHDTYTIEEHLMNQVRFRIPKKAVRAILAERGVSPDTPFVSCEESVRRLCYADMLRWLLVGASKMNNVSDTDNGWSHTEGGYELSSSDRSELRALANAIYRELEPSSVLQSRCSFRVLTLGVKRSNRPLCGMSAPPYYDD